MASKEPDEKLSNSKTGEETIALEKTRSKSRRVSFAETTAIHLFIRDEDCETPPEVDSPDNSCLPRNESDDFRALLDDDGGGGGSGGGDNNGIAVDPSFLRPFESPSSGSYFGSASSNDEDIYFGPVSADFIRPGRLSDSAASDENHDVTMDSTAFSMHFRSLARSESGGEFKTPTEVRLAFGERTSGQMSNTTSDGDLMVLSTFNKRVSGSLLDDAVNYSGNSDDMSIVEENHRMYDYAKLPPELDALLAESGLHQNGFELSDINNTEKVSHHVSDVKKTSDDAYSAVLVNIDNGNDGVIHDTHGETTPNTSINMDDDLVPVIFSDDQNHQIKTPILMSDVMPVDKDEDARKGAVETSGKFLSPLSSSLSDLNHKQPTAGSVSSLLAERRHIFRVSPSNKSNLIVSEKKLCDKGSKHVLGASSFEKGVSRVLGLEAISFTSASKAEGNALRLKPPESLTSSLPRNYVLKYGNKDILVDHLAAPVACLDKQFSNVAEDDGELKSTGNMGRYNMRTTLGDAHCESYAEAKDAELSSLYASSCSLDNPSKFTGISVSSLAFLNEKQSESFVSTDNHAKDTVLSTGSDCSLLEITFNDMKKNKETGVLNNSAFSPTSAERKVSDSPLYQGSLSKYMNQQPEFSLRLDEDITQEAGDLSSRSENPSSFKREKEAKRFSSNIKRSETVSHEMQNAESTCVQAALMDKASELCNLVTTIANFENGNMFTRAIPVKNMEYVIGSASTSDNLIELPIQVSENHQEEPSCSLLQKNPRLADKAMVGITVTPRDDELTRKHDENDRAVLKSSNISGSDSSSSLKRKLFDIPEDENDEISLFQHKPKLCKDQKHYGGDSKVLNSFDGMTKLLPSLADKLTLYQIRVLNDYLNKMRSFVLLDCEIGSQDAYDSAKSLQIRRSVDTKSLLYKLLYQKAIQQLMRLERDKLLDKVRQLESRAEESKMLISSYQGSFTRGQKDVEVDCLSVVSCSTGLRKTSLVAAEIPSLRKDLEVSESKIKNLKGSFDAYIKVMKEQTCSEASVHVKKILRKRIACKSLQSEFQLCQVDSMKDMDGKLNILFDYGRIMSQRFVVKSISTYGLFISNVLNNAKISKMFIMDARPAFSFVLCGETNLAYSGSRVIAQETQKSSSLLHTLLDVVEEVEIAMIELRNLWDTSFLQPSAGKLDLRLCFTDFNSGGRVTLSIDITCLNRLHMTWKGSVGLVLTDCNAFAPNGSTRKVFKVE
ncbi:hypothetical protein SOVF_015300 isoform B [Spinacia oleracea]|nr:hypothetical protein SOVF_015300 isoform B [Spinacia oleracea]